MMSARKCHHAWQIIVSGRRAVRQCMHCPAVRPARTVRTRETGQASARLIVAVGVLVLLVPLVGLCTMAVGILSGPLAGPVKLVEVTDRLVPPGVVVPPTRIVWDSPMVDTSRVDILR
jgi:hypothetical protein